MEQALSNGIKDTMWSMFWKGKQKANLPELEDAVKRLIRMTTQKNAGQRKDATISAERSSAITVDGSISIHGKRHMRKARAYGRKTMADE